MLQASIMLVSGDNASDRFGAGLARALYRAVPEMRLFGIGGWQMQEAGVDILYNTADLDNLGVLDASKGGAVLKRVVKKANQMMEENQPLVVVQVGLPVFDYRLMDMAQCKDIPVVYYHTPFSNGFGGANPNRLANLVSIVAAVTQPEARAWEEAGVPDELVGHPLVDLLEVVGREQARRTLELNAADSVLAIIPGSREVEAKSIVPVLLNAVRRVRETLPRLKVLVGQPSGVSQDSMLEILGDAVPDTVVFTQYPSLAMQAADAVVVDGGTASLEAALCEIPALAVYKTAGTTYLMDKMLERRNHWALPNVLLDDAIIPELIQQDFTETHTAQWILELLSNEKARARVITGYKGLRDQLGLPGSLDRAAQVVVSAARVHVSQKG